MSLFKALSFLCILSLVFSIIPPTGIWQNVKAEDIALYVMDYQVKIKSITVNDKVVTSDVIGKYISAIKTSSGSDTVDFKNNANIPVYLPKEYFTQETNTVVINATTDTNKTISRWEFYCNNEFITQRLNQTSWTLPIGIRTYTVSTGGNQPEFNFKVIVYFSDGSSVEATDLKKLIINSKYENHPPVGNISVPIAIPQCIFANKSNNKY